MRAAEGQRRNQRQMERRAKPARRSSRFMYPKTAARRLHQSRCDPKNQNPQNGQLMARFDWGLGAICFGASPVAAVFGSAPGSATSPEHRIHSNPNPRICPSKQDISTLLGIGHFYFALTLRARCGRRKTEDRSQKSGVRKQKSEDRSRKTEDRMLQRGIDGQRERNSSFAERNIGPRINRMNTDKTISFQSRSWRFIGRLKHAHQALTTL